MLDDVISQDGKCQAREPRIYTVDVHARLQQRTTTCLIFRTHHEH